MIEIAVYVRLKSLWVAQTVMWCIVLNSIDTKAVHFMYSHYFEASHYRIEMKLSLSVKVMAFVDQGCDYKKKLTLCFSCLLDQLFY